MVPTLGRVVGRRASEEVVSGMARHGAVEEAVAAAGSGEEVEAEEHRSERGLLWGIVV